MQTPDVRVDCTSTLGAYAHASVGGSEDVPPPESEWLAAEMGSPTPYVWKKGEWNFERGTPDQDFVADGLE